MIKEGRELKQQEIGASCRHLRSLMHAVLPKDQAVMLSVTCIVSNILPCLSS